MAMDSSHTASYEPDRSKITPPSHTPRKLPTWCLRNTTPNSVESVPRPNSCATRPVVTGAVPSHRKPIALANSKVENWLTGARKYTVITAVRTR